MSNTNKPKVYIYVQDGVVFGARSDIDCELFVIDNKIVGSNCEKFWFEQVKDLQRIPIIQPPSKTNPFVTNTPPSSLLQSIVPSCKTTKKSHGCGNSCGNDCDSCSNQCECEK